MDAQDYRLCKLKADVIAAAGHPIRVAIIDFLAGGERCVCEIIDFLGAKRSNVSRHLGVMLKAGILTQRKDGLKMMYSLRTPCILNFTKCVEGVLRENAIEARKVLQSL